MIKKGQSQRSRADGSSTRYKPVATTSGQRFLRETILAKVFATQAPSIVVLQAPAGHGKSTVLRQIRDECAQQSVSFFFKQWGGFRPKSGGRDLDGREWNEFPAPRMVG